MANGWNWKALAVTMGTVLGMILSLASLFAMAGKEFWVFNSMTWPIMAKTYGLTATAAGAVWGLVIGIVCGAICGTLIATFYNWANKKWK